ncbi:MAG: hypothetical protein ACI4O5_03425, partial [Oscillospiraceae bacterium]
MKKRIVCLLLALLMGLSLAACGGSKTGTEEQKPTSSGNNGTEVDTSSMSYDELSAYIYEQVLGEFYSTYEAAKATESVSERYALAAIAEAKLLESG